MKSLCATGRPWSTPTDSPAARARSASLASARASSSLSVTIALTLGDVVLWVADLEPEGKHHLIRVIPGCELSVKEPGFGGSDAGPICNSSTS